MENKSSSSGDANSNIPACTTVEGSQDCVSTSERRYQMELIYRAVISIYDEYGSLRKKEREEILRTRVLEQAKIYDDIAKEDEKLVTKENLIKNLERKSPRAMLQNWDETKAYINNTMTPTYLKLVDHKMQPRSGFSSIDDVLPQFRQCLWDQTRIESGNEKARKKLRSVAALESNGVEWALERQSHIEASPTLQHFSQELQTREPVSQAEAANHVEQSPGNPPRKNKRKSIFDSEAVPSWWYPAAWNVFIKHGPPILIGNPAAKIHEIFSLFKSAGAKPPAADPTDWLAKSRTKQRFMAADRKRRSLEGASSIDENTKTASKTSKANSSDEKMESGAFAENAVLDILAEQEEIQGIYAITLQREQYESDISQFERVIKLLDAGDPRAETIKNMLVDRVSMEMQKRNSSTTLMAGNIGTSVVAGTLENVLSASENQTRVVGSKAQQEPDEGSGWERIQDADSQANKKVGQAKLDSTNDISE